MEEKEKRWSIDAFQTVSCKDKKNVPFLNVFIFEGLTQKQKKMGQLFGVIQVFDYNEKSAYLPNLIAQVIKKEFFKEEKRSSEESFEAALRKANLALSDLASHEIIGWIGKFHTAIGAIQNNNLWFSQTGGGKIILVRKKTANEISQEMSNEESFSHPIKTFSNISSGKLEDGDKIIFATENVFDKKHWEEFLRHVRTFSSAELDNLIRSTVELEIDNSGFVLVNIQQSPIIIEKEENEDRTPVDLNFFGKIEKEAIKKSENSSFLLTQQDENKDEKVDLETSPFEKEPEVYIKETDKIEPASQIAEKNIQEKKEKEKSLLAKIQIPIKRFSSPSILPRIQSIIKNIKTSGSKIPEKIANLKPKFNIITSTKEKIACLFQKEQSGNFFQKKEEDEKIKSYFTKKQFSVFLKKSILSKKNWMILATVFLVFFFIKVILLKKNSLYLNLSLEQTQIKKTAENSLQNSPDNLEEKKLKELISLPEKVVSFALLKEKLYFLTENHNFYQLDKLEEKNPELEKIELTEEVQKAQSIVAMNDLNLIFLITSNQVFAYSPVTKKILLNDINNLPNQRIASFSYLTYLYFLSPSENQIFQYPRAGTGFGNRKNWIRELTDLQSAIDFTADEAIYILFEDGHIDRYFRGKKTSSFFIEKEEQKVVGKKIRASIESEWIFTLSPENQSVYQLDKTGKIINQWTSPQLSSAQIIEVNFSKKTVFIINQEQKVLEIKY